MDTTTTTTSGILRTVVALKTVGYYSKKMDIDYGVAWHFEKSFVTVLALKIASSMIDSWS